MRALMIAALAASLSTAALAQATPDPANNPNDKLGLEQNPGLGQMDKPKDQIRVEESSILPNAGAASGTQSAAPTMKLDCQKAPSDCSDPVKSTGSTAPGLPVQSK